MSRLTASAAGLFCALALLTSGALPAQDYNLILKTGVGYTDNVTRTAASPDSASAAIAGLEFTAQRDKGRLTLEGIADISYLWFFGTDVVDNDLFGSADFRGAYEIIQDRFSWMASESYSRLREDFLLPFSPNNSQGFNQLQTGPNLTLPLSANMDFEAEGRYSRSDYSSSQEFDSQRFLGGIGLTRRLSPRTQIGISGSVERFEAEDTTVILDNPEFDRREYSLEFLTQSVRSELNIEAGVTEVEGAAVDQSGPLFRILLLRRLTPSLSLQFDAGREFSTTGERARRFRVDEAPTSDYDLLLPAAEPFEQTRFGGTLTYRRPRTTMSLTASSVKEEYTVSTSVNRRLGDFRFVLQRRMTPQLDLTFQAGQTTDKLEGQAYDVEDRLLALALRWRFTRAMSVAMTLEDRRRDGTLGFFDYDELSARLLLRYAPWSPDSVTTESVEGPR